MSATKKFYVIRSFDDSFDGFSSVEYFFKNFTSKELLVFCEELKDNGCDFTVYQKTYDNKLCYFVGTPISTEQAFLEVAYRCL